MTANTSSTNQYLSGSGTVPETSTKHRALLEPVPVLLRGGSYERTGAEYRQGETASKPIDSAPGRCSARTARPAEGVRVNASGPRPTFVAIEAGENASKAVALATVAEAEKPKAGPGRGHKAKEETNPQNAGPFSSRAADAEAERLRAINRAPEPARDLFRADLMSKGVAVATGLHCAQVSTTQQCRLRRSGRSRGPRCLRAPTLRGEVIAACEEELSAVLEAQGRKWERCDREWVQVLVCVDGERDRQLRRLQAKAREVLRLARELAAVPGGEPIADRYVQTVAPIVRFDWCPPEAWSPWPALMPEGRLDALDCLIVELFIRRIRDGFPWGRAHKVTARDLAVVALAVGAWWPTIDDRNADVRRVIKLTTETIRHRLRRFR